MIAAAALVCLLNPAWGKTEDDSPWSEYRLKANFLTTAPNFVNWPPNPSAGESDSFPICVFGRNAFATDLEEVAETKKVHGKRVEVRWIRQEAELKGCRVAFVGKSEAKHYATVLEAVKDTSTLTVGETPEFLEAGGMIELEMHPAGLQFDVNLGPAERAGLRFSSALLALAKRVTGRKGLARN